MDSNIPGKTNRIFIENQNISKHLYCSVCHQVFENPNRLICGHTFCYACIVLWTNRKRKCPNCNKCVMQRRLQVDLIAQNIIDDFRVKCGNEKCKWEGLHSLYKKHYRNCEHKKKKTPKTEQRQEILDLSSGSEEVKQK